MDAFSNPFDIIIIVLLLYAIFMLATGRGDKLMGTFNPAQQQKMEKTYDRETMYKASLVLCIILLIAELILVFLARENRYFALLSIVISIVALVGYIVYLQKIRKK